MADKHDSEDVYRGDTWEIQGTLLGADNQPLNLAGAVIEWALLSEDHAKVAEGSTTAGQIVITNPAGGQCMITIPSATTDDVTPGRYLDQLRVTLAGIITTVWSGPIVVKDSPFAPAL